jgi:hypothetical protein
MPNSGLCRMGFVPWWRTLGEPAGTPFSCSAAFGIIRHASQAFEEAKQLIVRSVRSSPSFDRSSLRQHLLFQGEVCVEVDLGCFDGFVTQPECDEGPIHSRLEQFHGGRVAAMSLET